MRRGGRSRRGSPRDPQCPPVVTTTLSAKATSRQRRSIRTIGATFAGEKAATMCWLRVDRGRRQNEAAETPLSRRQAFKQLLFLLDALLAAGGR